MTTKTFEIRDSATFIPALAIRLDPSCEEDRYLLARAGFGRDCRAQRQYIVLFHLVNDIGHWDYLQWEGGTRTMPRAHRYIMDHFDELQSGQVIDVQVILGETKEPKKSERVTAPL